MNVNAIIILWVRLILGTIILFYPFNFITPYKEILVLIGSLIILTSGIEVKFSHLLKDIIK